MWFFKAVPPEFLLKLSPYPAEYILQNPKRAKKGTICPSGKEREYQNYNKSGGSNYTSTQVFNSRWNELEEKDQVDILIGDKVSVIEEYPGYQQKDNNRKNNTYFAQS